MYTETFMNASVYVYVCKFITHSLNSASPSNFILTSKPPNYKVVSVKQNGDIFNEIPTSILFPAIQIQSSHHAAVTPLRLFPQVKIRQTVNIKKAPPPPPLFPSSSIAV